MRALSTPMIGQPSAEADRETAPWWPVFRNLRTARTDFGLKSRHLTTLAALLSFLRPQDPQMMVFASNLTILDRLNGLSERSLQRHVLDLIEAGLIRRCDSPNGKRFRLRGKGCDVLSFGFDLSPLMERADEIAQVAEAIAERDAARALLRQQVLLRLAEDRALTDEAEAKMRLALRRNLDAGELSAMLLELSAAQEHQSVDCDKTLPPPCPATTDAEDEVRAYHAEPQTAKMSASSRQNVGQYQKSNTKDSIDRHSSSAKPLSETHAGGLLRKLNAACPSLATWLPHGHQTWRDITSQIRQVAGWIGVSEQVYSSAETENGVETTAATLLAILERATHIRQPAAYFHSLMLGSRRAGFSAERLLARLASQSAQPDVIRG